MLLDGKIFGFNLVDEPVDCSGTYRPKNKRPTCRADVLERRKIGKIVKIGSGLL